MFIQDYQNKLIKKHEKTLLRDKLDHLSIKTDHFGPVIVGYEHLEPIDELLYHIRNEATPFAVWSTEDNRKHKVWRVPSYIS